LCGGSFQCADGRFTLGSSIPAKFFASQFQKVEDWVLVSIEPILFWLVLTPYEVLKPATH
jgi:hypothetical protein